MKKRTKVILFISAIVLSLVIGVLVIIFPTQSKDIIQKTWTYLNKPLPVVGISILMIALILWRIFASTSFGKKQILAFKRETESTKEQFTLLKEDYDRYREESKKIIDDAMDQLAYYKDLLKDVCKTSPNAKQRAIGEKIDGKEKEKINN